jgi:multidrug efflux pump subunit AcrA (membrane-fusion protein)
MSVDLSQLAVVREPQRPKRVRRARHWLARYVIPIGLLVGFVAVVMWAGRDWWAPPREVTVVPLEMTQSLARRAGTPLFQAAGWIEPRPTEIRVAALAPGVVERLYVVEDQLVEQGAPVAELVKADAQLALQRAEADEALRRAEADEARAVLAAATVRLKQPAHLRAPLEEAEAELAEVETELANLPFELERAEAEAEFARLDYERREALEDSVARRVIDQAHSVLRSAEASVNALRARQKALDNQRQALIARRDALAQLLELKTDEQQAFDTATARLKAAEAAVAQAVVATAEANLRLERMTLYAPVTGRILTIVAVPGTRLMTDGAQTDMADPSTVVTMYRPDALQARVDVRFDDATAVTLGQEVEISSPALEKPLHGKVLFISSQADIQKNTLQVKVELIDPSPLLKPDALVNATFLAPAVETAETEDAPVQLWVPVQLVHRDDAGSFVWVVDQSAGRVRRVAVQTIGSPHEGMVEVSGELGVTSRLVAGDGAGLVDGQRIRVIGESSADAAVSAAPAHAEPMAQRPGGPPPMNQSR